MMLNRTSKLAITAASVLGILVLASGCGSSPEQDFLDSIHKAEPTSITAVSNDKLLASGRLICVFYTENGDAGVRAALDNVGATQGAEPERLMNLVAEKARMYLCP